VYAVSYGVLRRHLREDPHRQFLYRIVHKYLPNRSGVVFSIMAWQSDLRLVIRALQHDADQQ
jgi:hypothetical protein